MQKRNMMNQHSVKDTSFSCAALNEQLAIVKRERKGKIYTKYVAITNLC